MNKTKTIILHLVNEEKVRIKNVTSVVYPAWGVVIEGEYFNEGVPGVFRFHKEAILFTEAYE